MKTTTHKYFWLMLGLIAALIFVSESASAQYHKIGDTYLDGKVFWVDITGQHGLVAAPIDLTTGPVDWQSAKNALTGGWILPSQDELRMLCANRSCAGISGIDGTATYWSSQSWTNSTSSGSYTVEFSTCKKSGKPKTDLCRARAIKKF